MRISIKSVKIEAEDTKEGWETMGRISYDRGIGRRSIHNSIIQVFATQIVLTLTYQMRY